ncbi:MAG: OmpA family protein, partial [Actinomycetota bacterium]
VSVLLGVAAIDNRVILAPAETETETDVEAEVSGETADTEDIDADATVEADVEADVEASTEATGSSAPLDTSVPAGSTLNAALALAPVSFDSGSPDLTAEGLAVVERVAAHLTEHPNLAVEIGGHTDDDGDENANMELSQQRADAVRTALIDAGIAAERLTAVGYGEAEPIVDNTTADNKARNRRIVFTVA